MIRPHTHCYACGRPVFDGATGESHGPGYEHGRDADSCELHAPRPFVLPDWRVGAVETIEFDPGSAPAGFFRITNVETVTLTVRLLGDTVD